MHQYNPRPGTPDGPPAEDGRVKKSANLIVGAIVVGIPTLLILMAMIWAIVWMVVNFPTG